MIVIGHEHVGVQPQAEALHPLGEQLQEMFPVTFIAKGDALFIATRGQMIPPTGTDHTQESGHGPAE